MVPPGPVADAGWTPPSCRDRTHHGPRVGVPRAVVPGSSTAAGAAALDTGSCSVRAGPEGHCTVQVAEFHSGPASVGLSSTPEMADW